MKRSILSYILLLLVFPLQVFAGGKATDDQKLAALIAQLNSADGYSYQASVSSELIGNSKEKQSFTMTNYQSRQSFIVYSKTDDMLLFLCNNGQFRVNFKDKQVFYCQFPTDGTALQQQKDRLLAQFDMYSVNDFLLRDATISGKTNSKTNITYKLAYPASSMVRNAVIDYNVQTAFFTSLSYTMERPMAGFEAGGPSNMIVRQKVVMDHYTQMQPPIIKQLLSETRDMLPYLERMYKGYELKKINL